MFRQSLLICVAGLTLYSNAMAEEAASDDNNALTQTDTRLQHVTVSGLRPIPVEDITGAVTLLNAEDLSIRNASYLADQLRMVPGVGVSRSGSKGGLTQVRIRGAEANHTLVLINGIEVSDPTTGETNFGLLSGLNISRVEILRGEQSGLFGSGAIGGVVNVITDPQNGPSGQIEYGSLETIRTAAGYGRAFDKGSLGLNISAFRTDGVDTSDSNGESDGTEDWSATLTGALDLPSDWTLNGLARYSDSEAQFDSDTDFDGLLNDADLSSETEQWLMGVALEGDAFGLNHAIRASQTSITRENFAAGASSDTSEGERTKLSYSPSLEISDAFADYIRLSGILEYENEDYTIRDNQYGGLTDQDQSVETLGIGADLNIQWGDLVTFAALRHNDNQGRFDDALSARIGASYDTATYGRFRASFGNGTKNPTFTELFGFFPGSFIGNSDLKPETSTGWEIGWQTSWQAIEFDLTYFEAELEDEIFTSFTPAFLSTPLNRTGKSERSGVELAANWYASDEISLNGQVSIIDSSADDGSMEVRVPEQTASLALSYNPQSAPDYRFGVALDYVGDQDDFDFGSFPSRRVTLDSYVLFSASAEIPLTKALSLTLRGENLLDQETVDVFGYAAPGATAYIGLKLR